MIAYGSSNDNESKSRPALIQGEIYNFYKRRRLVSHNHNSTNFKNLTVFYRVYQWRVVRKRRWMSALSTSVPSRIPHWHRKKTTFLSLFHLWQSTSTWITNSISNPRRNASITPIVRYSFWKIVIIQKQAFSFRRQITDWRWICLCDDGIESK